MDLDAALPDLDRLTLEEAVDTSRLVRTRLRPRMLGGLARLYREREVSPSSGSEISTLEARIEELDAYGARLDQLILTECPPPPAQFQTPAFTRIEQEGSEYVEADSELFFSAESLTVVHGPVMIYHLATLAELLLHPGESIIGLRKTTFRKLVVYQMRFHVCDAARGFRAAAGQCLEDAAVTGSFALSSGRSLDFFGIQLPGRPVPSFANFNSFALSLLPKRLGDIWADDRYRLELATRVPESVADRLTPAATLMSSLDVLIVMLLMLPYPETTRLLLRIAEMDILPDPVGQLTSGITLEVRPHRERKLPHGMRIIMAGYRFAPLEEKLKGLQVGLTESPYYKLIAS